MQSSNRPSFFADAMLGTIAKKLRILGFDCAYMPSLDDEKVLQVAETERRTVITRDRGLAAKCKKQGVAAVGIASHGEKEQLIQIARECGLAPYELDINSTRCVACNGVLDRVPKETVMSELPDRVASGVESFWRCSGCGHVYWEGTHIRNVRKMIDEINAGL